MAAFLTFFDLCATIVACRLRAPWPPFGGTCRSPELAGWAAHGGSEGWGFAPASPCLSLARPAGLGGRLSRLAVCGSEMVGVGQYALAWGWARGFARRGACRLRVFGWVRCLLRTCQRL
eukprot:scaffold191019_cov26-Tisochrysis_lutea.AAC.1